MESLVHVELFNYSKMADYTNYFFNAGLHSLSIYAINLKSFRLYETHNLIAVYSLRTNFRLYEFLPFCKTIY